MNNLSQIQNRNDLVRDTHSKAILSTNIEALESWKKRKEKNDKVERHESDINSMKNELIEIKSMVQEIIKVIN